MNFFFWWIPHSLELYIYCLHIYLPPWWLFFNSIFLSEHLYPGQLSSPPQMLVFLKILLLVLFFWGIQYFHHLGKRNSIIIKCKLSALLIGLHYKPFELFLFKIDIISIIIPPFYLPLCLYFILIVRPFILYTFTSSTNLHLSAIYLGFSVQHSNWNVCFWTSLDSAFENVHSSDPQDFFNSPRLILSKFSLQYSKIRLFVLLYLTVYIK